MNDELAAAFSMDAKRFRELQYGEATMLTKEEIDQGWHWCAEMNDLMCIRGGEDCHCY